MSKTISSSVVLPILYVLLRILVVLNWLGGAAIFALLVVLPNEQWIMTAFKLSPSPEAERLVMGLRTIGEAVESEAALRVLQEIGVDYAQGYWLGAPEQL